MQNYQLMTGLDAIYLLEQKLQLHMIFTLQQLYSTDAHLWHIP